MGRFAQKLNIGVHGALDVSLEQTCFRPGDVVSGCVRLVVERPITIRGLIATLSGRERLYWEHTDNHGRHPHSRSLELLDEKVMLIDPKANGDDKVSLDCCTREFNVEFQIPKKLPAMFEYKCRRIKCMERVRIYIEYLVTATLLVDGFLKANLSAPFLS